MNFSNWQDEVPTSIREDTLWDVEAYRLSLFASDVCWQDIRKLHDESHTQSLADQLYRAVGSISSNIAEGYSRGTGKDRARFYEYALGSARESRDWYYKSRFVIGEDVVAHRLDFMTQIIRLLLVMVSDQRGGEIREPNSEYRASEHSETELLEEIPFASE
jgi:four helix bundle protein